MFQQTAAIGGISLIVGAVGILTIMTIAITERTAEIGLLRALGARRIHILYLFLCEAIVLSITGGLSGAISAIAVVTLANFFLPALPIEISWQYTALALLLAVVIGLASGIIPAMRAAGLHPLEALRAE